MVECDTWLHELLLLCTVDDVRSAFTKLVIKVLNYILKYERATLLLLV